MKAHKYIVSILLPLLLGNLLSAQPNKNLGYVWSQEKRKYEKVNVSRSTLTKVESKRIPTATKRSWVLPTKDVPGHWDRVMQGEIEKRNSIKAHYTYPVTISSYSSYPYYKNNGKTATAPDKSFNLAAIAEKKEWLGKQVIKNEGLKGTKNRMNVHYVKKIDLGLINLYGAQDHIIVTDTLIVPPAGTLKTFFTCIDRQERPYIKVIANSIVYESPISLNIIGTSESDFVITSPNILFKSVYKDLQKLELTPAPPLVVVADGTTNIFKNNLGNSDKILLNRLYINIMQEILSALNTTADVWMKDLLVEQFQVNRYQKIRNETLTQDTEYEKTLNALCRDFDSIFKDFKIEKKRDFSGFIILADGNVSKLPLRPIKYYVLPSKAKVLPVTKDNADALGTILYSAEDDVKLKMTIESELGYSQQKLNEVRAALVKKDVTIEENIPENFLSLKEQPLKINGKNIGRIIPIDNKLIRMEMSLPDEGRSILEIFPKMGSTTFTVDFNVDNETLTQEFILENDSSLTNNLNYNEPLQSFDVLETNELTSSVTISSALAPFRNDEGMLRYVEVLLEFQFPDRNILRGPYRLSAHNTIASKIVIPYLKYNNNVSIVVSGRVMYEDGERNLKPFENDGEIIIIDENKLDR